MGKKTLTVTQRAQLNFWTGFHGYASKRAVRIAPTAPQPDSSMGIAIGKDGFLLIAFAVTRNWDGRSEPEIRASLAIYSKNPEGHFTLLGKERDAIHEEFGDELDWITKPRVLQHTIHLRRAVDWRNPDVREDCYRWLVEKLDGLHKVFQPRIERLP